MLADRSDLEPVLDDLEPAEEHLPPRRTPRVDLRTLTLLLALVTAVAGLGFGTAQRREVAEAERRFAAMRREVDDATAAQTKAHADLEAALVAEAERERARARAVEEERFQATANEHWIRDPIISFPAGTRMCAADELEVVHPGGEVHGLSVVNRGARPCAVADHPRLEGLDEGGRWRVILTRPSPAPTYTDGPPWTGMLAPGDEVLLGIRHRFPLRSGICASGSAVPEKFRGLRLVLMPTAPPLVVPDATFIVGRCQPEVLLWAYDHQGV